MKRIYGLILSIFIALMGLSAMFLVISSVSVMAEESRAPEASIIVNTLEDELNSDGDCSLSEAIQAANNNIATDACPAGDSAMTDIITFDVAGTISVTRQLTVTAGGPLMINGGEVITISGEEIPILLVVTGADLALEGLTIANGVSWDGPGGGIDNEGTLDILNCSISGNAGTIFGGGGILNGGILTISNSTLTDNGAEYGGAIDNHGKVYITNSTLSRNRGGAIENSGIMTITNSTLSDNTTYYFGGAIANGGTMYITNSTLSGNTKCDWCSGISGGAIENSGIMTIINSTLSENSAASGGAISNGGILTITNSTLSENSATYATGGIYNSATDYYNPKIIKITITGSTLSGNSGEGGGGIYNAGRVTGVTVSGSIFANSSSGVYCAGNPITDGGYNLEDTDTCGFDPANGSLINTNPLLGPLQDNGGPTWTHALLIGSPAIDVWDSENCPPIDQRGAYRPKDGNEDGVAICDIGSFEYFIPAAPSHVIIDGPATGNVLESHSFTATINPITATLPIAYVWQASEQASVTHIGGLTDRITYAWELLGTKAITVTVSNLGGSIQASEVIQIALPEIKIFIPIIIQTAPSSPEAMYQR